MDKVMKTAIVIVVFATVLVLFGGRALAANTELPAVSEYPGSPKQRLVVDCATLKGDLLNIREAFLLRHDSMSGFLEEATLVVSSWSEKLRRYEGQTVLFTEGYFGNTHLTAERLSAASDSVYGEGDFVDRMVAVLQGAVTNCAAEDQKAELQTKLDTFNERENTHVASTASFIATMQGRLSDWANIWTQNEGREFAVPVDFFLVLEEAASQFGEATDLVRQNGHLSLEVFDQFSALIAP